MHAPLKQSIQVNIKFGNLLEALTQVANKNTRKLLLGKSSSIPFRSIYLFHLQCASVKELYLYNHEMAILGCIPNKSS